MVGSRRVGGGGYFLLRLLKIRCLRIEDVGRWVVFEGHHTRTDPGVLVVFVWRSHKAD